MVDIMSCNASQAWLDENAYTSCPRCSRGYAEHAAQLMPVSLVTSAPLMPSPVSSVRGQMPVGETSVLPSVRGQMPVGSAVDSSRRSDDARSSSRGEEIVLTDISAISGIPYEEYTEEDRRADEQEGGDLTPPAQREAPSEEDVEFIASEQSEEELSDLGDEEFRDKKVVAETQDEIDELCREAVPLSFLAQPPRVPSTQSDSKLVSQYVQDVQARKQPGSKQSLVPMHLEEGRETHTAVYRPSERRQDLEDRGQRHGHGTSSAAHRSGGMSSEWSIDHASRPSYPSHRGEHRENQDRHQSRHYQSSSSSAGQRFFESERSSTSSRTQEAKHRRSDDERERETRRDTYDSTKRQRTDTRHSNERLATSHSRHSERDTGDDSRPSRSHSSRSERVRSAQEERDEREEREVSHHHGLQRSSHHPQSRQVQEQVDQTVDRSRREHEAVRAAKEAKAPLPIASATSAHRGLALPVDKRGGQRAVAKEDMQVVNKRVYFLHTASGEMFERAPPDYGIHPADYQLIPQGASEPLQGPAATVAALQLLPAVSDADIKVAKTLLTQYNRACRALERQEADLKKLYIAEDGEMAYPIMPKKWPQDMKERVKSMHVNMDTVRKTITEIANKYLDMEWTHQDDQTMRKVWTDCTRQHERELLNEKLQTTPVSSRETSPTRGASPTTCAHSHSALRAPILAPLTSASATSTSMTQPSSPLLGGSGDESDDELVSMATLTRSAATSRTFVSFADMLPSARQSASEQLTIRDDVSLGGQYVSSCAAMGDRTLLQRPPHRVVTVGYQYPNEAQRKRIVAMRRELKVSYDPNRLHLTGELRTLALQCYWTQHHEWIINHKMMDGTDKEGKRIRLAQCPDCELPLSKHKSGKVCGTPPKTCIPCAKDPTRCNICGCKIHSHGKKLYAQPLPPLTLLKPPTGQAPSGAPTVKEEESARTSTSSSAAPTSSPEVPTPTVNARQEDAETQDEFAASHAAIARHQQETERADHTQSSSAPTANRLVVRSAVLRMLRAPHTPQSSSDSQQSQLSQRSRQSQELSPQQGQPSPQSSRKRGRSESPPRLSPVRSPCKMTIEDLKPTLSPTCYSCKRPMGEHDHGTQRKPGKERQFKMPNKSEFPLFRDPKDKSLSDPTKFFRVFERALTHHGVPRNRYEAVLILTVSDDIAEWIEMVCVKECYLWAQVKSEFTKRYADHLRPVRLMKELEARTQQQGEAATAYIQDFARLVREIGQTESEYLVMRAEHGLLGLIKAQMQMQAAGAVQAERYARNLVTDASMQARLALQPAAGVYTTFYQLTEAAVYAEKTIAAYKSHRERAHPEGKPMPRRWGDGRPKQKPKLKRTSGAAANAAPDEEATPSPSPKGGKGGPTAKKIELKNGRPENMNPKHGKGKGHGKGKKQDKGKGKTDEKSTVECYLCKKVGHFKVDCRGNMKECNICGEAGHIIRDCPQHKAKKPRVERVASSIPLSYRTVAANKHRLLITSPDFNGQVCSRVFVDTCAGFSVMRLALAKQHGLKIHAPKKVLTFEGATKGMVTKRTGFVRLRIVVHYVLDGELAAVSFKKKFEVAEIREDFLLGTETLSTLYPDADIIHGSTDKDDITDWPQDVRREKPLKARPKIAGLETVKKQRQPWSTVASDAIEATVWNERDLYDADEEDEEESAHLSAVKSIED